MISGVEQEERGDFTVFEKEGRMVLTAAGMKKNAADAVALQKRLSTA